MLGTLPLALGILASPIAVIPAILLLLGPRPVPTCTAFLAGWTGGLTAVTGLAVLFAERLAVQGGTPAWLSWLRIAVGSLLLLYGLLTWLRRNAEQDPPKWLAGIADLPPGRAAGLGLALSVLNPKVFLLCLTAGLTIGIEGTGAGEELIALLLFLAIGSVEVLVPLGAFLAVGERAAVPLQRSRGWLDEHGTSVVIVVVVVIGAVMMFNGVRAL